MKKIFTLLTVCILVCTQTYEQEQQQSNSVTRRQSRATARDADVASLQNCLNGVTIGFAAGYNISNHAVKSYSLTPDTSHALKVQSLSKSKFVISSVLSIKLGKLGVSTANRLLNLNSIKLPDQKKFDLFSRLSINVSLNLIDVTSDNVAFNKSVDGGIGFGIFLNQFVQAGVSYDISTIRQLRDYVVNTYTDKSIPNGMSVYNALDEKDNNLFYNKTFGSLSFKVIFSLANKSQSCQ